MYFVKSFTEKYGTFYMNYSEICHIGIVHKLGKAFSFKYILVTSKNPQKYRPIEAFSIIGQILTCKQCFEKVTLP